MHVRVHRRVVHPRHRVVVEVRLFDSAVGGGDLADHREARAQYRRAFELRLHAIGVDDHARIHGKVDARNANTAFVESTSTSTTAATYE